MNSYLQQQNNSRRLITDPKTSFSNTSVSSENTCWTPPSLKQTAATPTNKRRFAQWLVTNGKVQSLYYVARCCMLLYITVGKLSTLKLLSHI